MAPIFGEQRLSRVSFKMQQLVEGQRLTTTHLRPSELIWWRELAKTHKNATDWPQILNSEHVTRLILLQELHKLGLVDYSPLDDPEFVARVGGEGVEPAPAGDPATGPTPQKNFMLLERLRELEIYKIELRLLDRFERAALVRVQFYVEQEYRKRKRWKLKWQNKKNRERSRWRRAQRTRRQKVMAIKKANEEKVAAEVGGEKESSRDQGGEKEASHDQAVKIEVPLEVPLETVITDPERVITGKIEERPEVELEVVRVGPNPRILICEYRLLADKVRVHVFVKSNVKFRRGMKFKMVEQAGGDWRYEGQLPRFVGRW